MHTENKIQNAFDSIAAGQELKSSTLDFLQEARRTGQQAPVPAGASACRHRRLQKSLPDTASQGRSRHPFSRTSLKLSLGTLCAMLVLFLGIGGMYTMLHVPVSYVSIDVNPSIELSLNRLDRVICATAYNTDGASILEHIDLDGKYYTDAIDLLMDSPAMAAYLVENAMPTFTIGADSHRTEQMLLQGVQDTHGCSGHGGSSYTADIHTLEEAHAYGLSFGKYAAYQVLAQYDANITAQDCQHMSMGEIHGRIAEHGHNAGHGHHGCSH